MRSIRMVFAAMTLAAMVIAAAPTVLRTVSARTVTIGLGGDYARLSQAAAAARPGDTLYLLSQDHAGGEFISGLHGLPGSPIVITGTPGAPARILGGTEALHFSDVSWLRIEWIEVTRQSGNGMNIDDGGTVETPSHNIVVADCRFTDMAASGNNDLLKLSGLDTFAILRCAFLDGAAGGSGVDMVGCHLGRIEENHFERLGSNGIQAKGGTRGIQILRNRFIDCGERAVNLGGSTGLAFFRPPNAGYEAADLLVRGNIFVGSRAPVAYVGAVRVRVENNTIWRPGNWVVRILQESVDPDRFVEVGESTFENNLVVVDSRLARLVNVGPNTRPETFSFRNNLFYHLESDAYVWDRLPGRAEGNIFDVDPALQDTLRFLPAEQSRVVGAGLPIDQGARDYYGRLFLDPPSIGAVERESTSDLPPVRTVRNLDLTSVETSGRASREGEDGVD